MLKVYGVPESLPVCPVILTLGTLDIKDYEFITVDPVKGDHKKPEFLQLNPSAMIPVIEDGDFVLTESCAILIYIAEKFGGKSHFLYPRDRPETSFKINQRLHFYSSTMAYKLAHGIVSIVKLTSLTYCLNKALIGSLFIPRAKFAAGKNR